MPKVTAKYQALHQLVRLAFTAAYRKDKALPEDERGLLTSAQLKRVSYIPNTPETTHVLQTLRGWGHLEARFQAGKYEFQYRLKKAHHIKDKLETNYEKDYWQLRGIE